MKRFSKGQSTLEYVIILAFVVGAILLIGGSMKTKLPATYDSLLNTMQTKVDGIGVTSTTTAPSTTAPTSTTPSTTAAPSITNPATDPGTPATLSPKGWNYIPN